jgi:hypothetical protein
VTSVAGVNGKGRSLRSSQRITGLSFPPSKCIPSIRDAAREKPKGLSIQNGCSFDIKYCLSQNISGNTPIDGSMSCLELEHDYEWYKKIYVQIGLMQ